MKKYFFSFVSVILFMVYMVSVSKAQDPLKVGPDIYKLKFENDQVRAMEISFKPGDKISMHSHPDHFVYIVSPGTLKLSYPDGSSKNFDGKIGDVIWIPAESHSAENTSTTEIKALVVELKKKM